MVTTMEAGNLFKTSGAPSTRSLLTSVVLHAVLVGLLLLIPAEAWRRS